MSIIAQLQQYCLEKKMTQKELAKRLGVTLVSVNRWFNKRSSPNKLQVYQIQKILGQTEQYSLDKAELHKYLTDKVEKRIESNSNLGYACAREDSPEYTPGKGLINSIALIKDAETGREEVFVSYLSRNAGGRVIYRSIPGKRLIELLEKSPGVDDDA
ncbi:MAG: hypothetical protein A2452_12185 [Candidatus Firestonebacteria bacterium RIFOXYC2_FULL_39_67]|nr:MAG: hypothetical protein A2536_07715 [Candidatus Firestonebacteria bacterium RIFOXYD2_FULL_39_29]OGF55607.1 MAG: hypothetical protein A2452_12185 [Candidatus Firestonebacteria bacterium RIFOXYC2_FULL_39_67]